jgi:hypothetical protein
MIGQFVKSNPIFSMTAISAVILMPAVIMTNGFSVLHIVWFALTLVTGIQVWLARQAKPDETVQVEKQELVLPKGMLPSEVAAFLAGAMMAAYAKEIDIRVRKIGKTEHVTVTAQYGNGDVVDMIVYPKIIYLTYNDNESIKLSREDFLPQGRVNNFVAMVKPARKPKQQEQPKSQSQPTQTSAPISAGAAKAAFKSGKTFDYRPTLSQEAKSIYKVEAYGDGSYGIAEIGG